MKYKVIKSFRDSKNDDKLYPKSKAEKVTVFECEKERFNEIQKKGNYLEELKEESKEEKQPKKAEVKE